MRWSKPPFWFILPFLIFVTFVKCFTILRSESIITRKLNTWDGSGLNQHDLMHKDECLIVDENDAIIGHASKYDSHRFTADNERGLLHRAFSVFLFNSSGKLLLQKRAAHKVTFPNVWTNTCCSHPLYGYLPDEVDDDEEVKSGKVRGVKAAASRKLKHELGMNDAAISPPMFKYLTRLHYCAKDVVNHGTHLPTWGEHEIDYILFLRGDFEVNPNPEEVSEVKYVNFRELQEMMQPSSGLLWSPWFRIIVERFLPLWWQDLDLTFSTDMQTNYQTIHKF